MLETLDINETQKTSLAIKDVQFRIDSSAFDALYGTSTEQSRIRQLLDSNSKLKKVLFTHIYVHHTQLTILRALPVNVRSCASPNET
jgi:hypothetical protein